jgi:hypothetical protein
MSTFTNKLDYSNLIKQNNNWENAVPVLEEVSEDWN